jgi:hypothetical protein
MYFLIIMWVSCAAFSFCGLFYEASSSWAALRQIKTT